MNEIQWYYARDDQRFGPVSTVELKRLAERGQLAPNDLVWRVGMPDWVEASQVKGLLQAAAAGEPAVEPTAQPSAPESSAPEPSATPAPVVQTAAVQPTPPKAKKPPRHVVEAVLALARERASEGFVDSSIRLFILLGHYALYLAMVLVVVAEAVVSYRQGNWMWVLLAVVLVPAMLVLQYAAGQFCKALDRVNRSTRATVASATLIDLIGVVSMVVGLVLLLAIAAHAMLISAYTVVLTALLVFIICEHLAAVSLVHVDPGVMVADHLTPGEEALGTLCAILKASARVVPVAYGAGVCCSTIALGVTCVQTVRSSDELGVTGVLALSNLGAVATFAALPMIGYLVFLLLALVFDVLDGLLTLRHGQPMEHDDQME